MADQKSDSQKIINNQWRVESTTVPAPKGSSVGDYRNPQRSVSEAGMPSTITPPIVPNINKSIPIGTIAKKQEDANNPQTKVEAAVTEAKVFEYVFPTNLRSSGTSEFGPYVKISAYSYKRGFVKQEDKKKLYSIMLPIPQIVNQEYSASLENFEGSMVFDAAAKLANEAGGTESMKAILGGGAAATGTLVQATVQRFLQGTGSQALASLGQLAGSVRNIVSSQVGYSLNPRYEVAFNSMGLRQHSFEFTLVPTEEVESDEIRSIVNALRLSAHPVTSDEALGIFYKYPDEFTISFHDADGNLLPDVPYIPDSLIANFGVSTSTGRLHSDNSPVMTKISIAFQEMVALDREDIRNINAGMNQK